MTYPTNCPEVLWVRSQEFQNLGLHLFNYCLVLDRLNPAQAKIAKEAVVVWTSIFLTCHEGLNIPLPLLDADFDAEELRPIFKLFELSPQELSTPPIFMERLIPLISAVLDLDSLDLELAICHIGAEDEDKDRIYEEIIRLEMTKL